MSSATCLLFCIFLCFSNCMGWNTDPTQVSAKTSTDFLSEKAFYPFSVLVVAYILVVIKLLCRAFKFLCNSSFNPPMFHWFWERNSSCLGSPKNKSEVRSVFYTVNLEYSFWSCVKEPHISRVLALEMETFLLCFNIAGRYSGDLVFGNWHVVMPIWFQGCLWKDTSAFPPCQFITGRWMSSKKLLWWAEWIGNGETGSVLLGQQEAAYTKLAIWILTPPAAPYNLSSSLTDPVRLFVYLCKQSLTCL